MEHERVFSWTNRQSNEQVVAGMRSVGTWNAMRAHDIPVRLTTMRNGHSEGQNVFRSVLWSGRRWTAAVVSRTYVKGCDNELRGRKAGLFFPADPALNDRGTAFAIAGREARNGLGWSYHAVLKEKRYGLSIAIRTPQPVPAVWLPTQRRDRGDGPVRSAQCPMSG